MPRDETSAARLDDAVLRAAAGETPADLRCRLRHAPLAAAPLLCVTDEQGRLIGTLEAAALLALPDDAPLGPACRRDAPRVGPGMDQERMASEALHHGVSALPVVDADGRLLGIVGPMTLMAVLRREHVEDLHRLAGIRREEAHARRALEDPPLRRVRHRLPWLLVGLAGSGVAALLMSRFEHALAALPALAFFVPGLVYVADAIGTQSEAVAVRGLSLSHAGLRSLIGGELRTGLLLGLVLALLAGPLVWLAFGRDLALAVALALTAASTLAAMLGLLLPWSIARLGLDPAYGSGPLATIIQDVLTLLVYFGCVAWLVT
jgi:magnesium transporter